MTPTGGCPRCGCALPADAPKGACPSCLMRLALDGPGATVALGERRSGSGSVLERIAATLGPVPRVLLRDTDAGFEPPLVRPGAEAGASVRYRLDGEIARGGMGAVLRGRDPDLGRDVAVKVLREDFRDSPEMVRRFVEEAQIGGQLQHPGVVPIYEMGTFADRRPYFAMKLVKGHTLAALLAARGAPSDQTARFLGIFQQVAQTVAYAHARGVIHRDLKPSNVMVGSFGEVQVMDWGLAKVLPRGGLADDGAAGEVPLQETVIATARSASGDPDLSQAGSVLGTPSYMAPEQARGEVERLDPRCDVFALGSILCEVLTGLPAFSGRGVEIQRKAAQGDTADAVGRLAACGAGPELVALAMRCLAREPDDRPADAAAVAERVTSYLAGVQEKLRRAEIERVEERARRRLTTVAAAAVLLLGAAAAGVYAWEEHQRSGRLVKTARLVEDALAEASRLRGQAAAATAGGAAGWTEALGAAKRAESLLAQGEADAPLRARVAGLVARIERDRAEAEARRKLREADRTLLAELEAVRAGRAEHWNSRQTDADYARAFAKAGLDFGATKPDAAGRWIAGRSEPVELAAYLDDWAARRLQRGTPIAACRPLVEAAQAADPDPWRNELRALIGRSDSDALATLRRLADDAAALDAQPAASLILLASRLRRNANDPDRAGRVLRRAALRHPGDFWVQYELARAPGTLANSGDVREFYPRPEEAARHLTAAVAVRPGSAMARNELCTALRLRGDLDGAAAQAREAIRLKPDLAGAYHNLWSSLTDQGKLDEAIAACREANRRVPDFASSYNDLGISLRAQGKTDDAIAAFREFVRLAPGAFYGHDNLGHALVVRGRLDEAIPELRKAIRLKPDFAWAHYNLGCALRGKGRHDEAATAFREAIRLQPDAAVAHDGLGAALIETRKLDEALDEVREAIRLGARGGIVSFHLGVALDLLGKDEEAAAAYREAVRLDGTHIGTAIFNLGRLLVRAGRYDEAEATFLRARDLSQGEGRTDLVEKARSLAEEAGRRKALLARLPDIVRGVDRPRGGAELDELGKLCRERRLHAAGARIFEAALKADPKLADDPARPIRAHAARLSALAGCGQGADAPPPDDREKDRLRALALAAARDEVVAGAERLRTASPAEREALDAQLDAWWTDPGLECVRSPDALEKLPAPERRAWQTLWLEMVALRRKARPAK